MKTPLTRLIYEDDTNFSPLISRDSYENEEENLLLIVAMSTWQNILNVCFSFNSNLNWKVFCYLKLPNMPYRFSQNRVP